MGEVRPVRMMRPAAVHAADSGNVQVGDAKEDAKVTGRGEARGWRSLPREYLCWFALCIGFHACLWGYTAYKSMHWRDLLSSGQMRVGGLRAGWLWGLPLDLSDPQWRTLRQFFPLLAIGIPIHAGLSRGARRLEALIPSAHVYFHVAANVGFIIFLHGGKSVWPLSIAAASFWIGRVFKGSRWNPLLTWIFCLSMVIASDYYRGFQRWRWSGTPLAFLEGWGNGVYSWQTQFNLTMLRLVSFNMERYWAHCFISVSPDRGQDEREEGKEREKAQSLVGMEAKQGGVTPWGEKGDGVRRETGVVLTCDEDYSWLHMVAYVFYIPLYIAGPIMTFPAWLTFLRHPQTLQSPSRIGLMLGRVAAYVLAIEIMLHVYLYVSINNNRSWDQIRDPREAMPGWEVAWGGFVTLNFMYLKFLSIWRLFRCWALADGMDPPENMRRCVNNNYSFAGFWRAWHASLNRWIVRYLYVPLGGRRSQWWSIWVVFSFIGLWHDLEWRWQAWAWLNCLFFSVELGLSAFFQRQYFDALWRHPGGKYLQALAASVNILALIFANLGLCVEREREN